jgi:hypothetical protein
MGSGGWLLIERVGPWSDEWIAVMREGTIKQGYDVTIHKLHLSGVVGRKTISQTD